MSSNVLKASLHIVVTLKEPAGYLAEQFISVGAVEAGGLEFTLSSLWTLLYHYGGISHKHGCLHFKELGLPIKPRYNILLQCAAPLGQHATLSTAAQTIQAN